MTRTCSIARPMLAAAWFAAAIACGTAAAAPVQLVPGTLNMFRDTRGANSVGINQGDLFQFGADIVGGSLGTTLGATYVPTGFTVSQFGCAPLAVNANFCSRTTAFSPNRLGDWALQFRNGADLLTVAAPSLAGTENAVPFPVSVTLSGSGMTPTISWQVPGAFAPDGFRINIFDKNRSTATGFADVVHSVSIAPNATSYVIPTQLSSGLQLAAGGNYAVNLQLIETRGHVAFTNNNAQILRRSSSFFDFTPLAGNAPPNVALPTFVNGVYNFNVANVGPSSIAFIDPFVAIGYDYAVGQGDPLFASVLLPDVGDGLFDLEYVHQGQTVNIALAHDVQFFFPQGGVDAFRVAGIETSAGLDPNNVTAFITGLTFASNGNFTGTMTPVTQFVPGPIPEPSTVALMLGGIALIGAQGLRRRRTR